MKHPIPIYYIVYLHPVCEDNPNELAFSRVISPFIYLTPPPQKLARNIFASSAEAVSYVLSAINVIKKSDPLEAQRIRVLLDEWLNGDVRKQDEDALLRCHLGGGI